MTRLLRAEFRRFSARRLTQLGLLTALVVVLIASWASWSSTKPPSDAAIAAQQAAYDSALADWETYGPAELEKCRAAVADPTLDPNGQFSGMSAAGCESLRPIREYFGWTAPTLGDQLRQVPMAVSLAIGIIAIALAASYIGAEFTTGSMSNWLTFEPRRTRVFASKMIVVTVASGAIAVAGNALLAAATVGVVAINRGSMTVPPALATHVAHTYWRGILMTIALSQIAGGLAFLTRHTAAVIGMIIGWMMIVEGTLVGLVGRLRVYSLVMNLEAWILGQASIFQERCDAKGCQTIERTITWVHGGVEWGLLTAAIVGLAWLIFARQDVT